VYVDTTRLTEEGPMNFGVWIPTCRHLATPDVIRGTALRAEQLDERMAVFAERMRPRLA
jgi:hypothetical protein